MGLVAQLVERWSPKPKVIGSSPILPAKRRMIMLEFIYGAMGAAKSANALMRYYNIKERGKRVLLTKPILDIRDEGVVRSRVGIEAPCVYFNEVRKMTRGELLKYDFIIVDEAQFLLDDEVELLATIADDLKITVICYGLRTDFKSKLFQGSKRLFELANKISEIETICWCGEKAIMNARIDKYGFVTKEGSQIELGGNEKYVALCREHWRTGELQ